MRKIIFWVLDGLHVPEHTKTTRAAKKPTKLFAEKDWYAEALERDLMGLL